MGEFLMICTVCTDFFAPNGEKFQITPQNRGIIVMAPNWIKETMMFKLLEIDGSVQFVTKANEKKLENDPMEGITAEGKKEEKPVSIDIADAPKPRRTRKKDDA